MLAAERGKPGERYLISGATITSHEALELVSRISGVRHDVRSCPPPVARAVGAAVEAGFRARGKKPPVCREMINTMLHGHHYDGSYARRRARSALHAGGGHVAPHDRVGARRRTRAHLSWVGSTSDDMESNREPYPRRGRSRLRPWPGPRGAAGGASATTSFSEGQEELPPDTPEKLHEGRFSEGQEELPPDTPEKLHEGASRGPGRATEARLRPGGPRRARPRPAARRRWRPR